MALGLIKHVRHAVWVLMRGQNSTYIKRMLAHDHECLQDRAENSGFMGIQSKIK